jgi:hypothetical protein
MRFGCSAIGTACFLLLAATGAGAKTGANAEHSLPGVSHLQLPNTRLAQITPPDRAGASSREMSSALPAPVTACSVAYHKALSEIRDGFPTRVELAHRLLHDADPQLPGRWLFTGFSSFSAPATAAAWAEDNRSCVAPHSRGARARCKRWEVENGSQLAGQSARPLPVEGERRLLRSLAEFVRGRRAVTDRGGDGRPTWATQRVAGELEAYVGQPVHPALCSGALEILDFYAGRLASFRKHMKAVADLDAAARELARTRVAAAKAAVPPPVSPPGTTVVGFSAPAFAFRGAGGIYPEMILETGAVLLPVEQIAHIKAERAPLAMLTRAAEAMSMDSIREQPPHLRDLVTAAFRVIEAGIYAEIMLGRYRELDAALVEMIERIREAHKTSCTCAE